MSVVLSSHLVADLERVCDYLIILVASQVQLAGEVSDLLELRTIGISGPRRDPKRDAVVQQEVIEESHTDKQSTFLIRTVTSRSSIQPGP